MPRWWVGTVRAVHDETPTARSLVLDIPGWQGHQPGQYVTVRLTAEDGYQAVRDYSIASAPEDPAVMLTVERLEDGEVSAYLTEEVRPGDQLELLGPIGSYFTWRAAMGGPLLLVAGGSGITPLMSMLRHRAVASRDVPARLLYSARSLEEVIYRTELERLADADDHLEVVYTLTRCRPAGWTGYTRRIDRAMLRDIAWPPEQVPLAYVAGPDGLVDAVSELLVDLGYASERVRTERFGPTG